VGREHDRPSVPRTTIATNAVLEHDGAESGLITTKGYRDILHIGRHRGRSTTRSCRRSVAGPAAVKRRHRLTVSERLVPPRAGAVPLDETRFAPRRASSRRPGQGDRRLLPVSYLDRATRIAPRRSSRKNIPTARHHLVVGVAAIPRVERFTTTAMNAFVGPKVPTTSAPRDRDGRGRLKADLHVMSSNGGVATAHGCRENRLITLRRTGRGRALRRLDRRLSDREALSPTMRYRPISPSKVISDSRSDRRPVQASASTPAAGPDSSVITVSRQPSPPVLRRRRSSSSRAGRP